MNIHANEENTYAVLLYYCFTPIEKAKEFRNKHHRFCLSLNLLGRIIISEEGLNGTVSGKIEDCEQYMKAIKSDPRFSKVDFKIEYHSEHAFQKLNVRYKDEIVHAGLPDIKPWEKTGKHLEPKEFKAMMHQDDVVVLDVRSDYEHHLGRFKNAVTLDIQNFREFPEKIKELDDLKDKKVLTYCTGGIKCEKASAFLLEQGFTDVYQLHGGIIKYGIEEKGEDFEGQCYVFDNRVATDVNSVNPSIISKCIVCGSASNHMVNCASESCNKHTVICDQCMENMEGCCSHQCKDSEDKRPWNPEGYYAKTQNGYNPYKHSKRS